MFCLLLQLSICTKFLTTCFWSERRKLKRLHTGKVSNHSLYLITEFNTANCREAPAGTSYELGTKISHDESFHLKDESNNNVQPTLQNHCLISASQNSTTAYQSISINPPPPITPSSSSRDNLRMLRPTIIIPRPNLIIIHRIIPQLKSKPPARRRILKHDSLFLSQHLPPLRSRWNCCAFYFTVSLSSGGPFLLSVSHLWR